MQVGKTASWAFGPLGAYTVRFNTALFTVKGRKDWNKWVFFDQSFVLCLCLEARALPEALHKVRKHLPTAPL